MEFVGSTVNFIGKFNPAVYQPAWLFQNGVENNNLANATTINNCSEDFANFSVSGTNYIIERNRFNVTSNFISLEEIINSKLIRLFCELTPNIPTKSTSLIKYIHFKLNNIKHWESLSSKFAPVSPWHDVGFEIEKNENYKNNGLNSMRMCSIEKLENCNLLKFVTVERSLYFQDSIGAFVLLEFLYDYEQEQPVNDFVKLAQSEAVKRAKEADDIFLKFKELN